MVTCTVGDWGGRKVSDLALAHQYVLYGAATHQSLLDLLTHWQPWCPELEWPDMAIHVPVLAAAITELMDRALVELRYGPEGGGVEVVLDKDLAYIVNGPSNWWNDVSTPRTELVLMESAGLAPIPEQRPDVYRCSPAPNVDGFRTVPLRE
jgi:hypothetical protein